jgi:hypothetical protein
MAGLQEFYIATSIMNCCRRHYLAIAIVSFSVLGLAVWYEHRRAQGYRELALVVSSVSAVTVYDVGIGNDFRSFIHNGEVVSSNSLSSVPSAPFPLEVFLRGAGSAKYQPVRGIWKGAVLAVLTLRDGSQRRVRLSYIGSAFALEGVPGDYTHKGGQDSEFYRTFKSIMADQFIPKRRDEQKKTPDSQGAGAE